MTGHCADPAHFRADDRHRLTLNHRLKRHVFHFAGHSKGRPACATGIIFAKCFTGGPQLFTYFCPLQARVRHQIIKIGTFLLQLIALAAQLHFFQAPQTAQAHVQNGFGLHVTQLFLTLFNLTIGQGPNVVAFRHRARVIPCPFFKHQCSFRFVVIPNDINHTIQIQEGQNEAFEHFQPMINFGQTMRRAAHQNFLPVIQECAQHFFHATDFWREAIYQHVHVQTEPQFKITVAIQHAHQQLRIYILAAWLENHPQIFCRFVAHIAQNWHFFCLNYFSQFFDQFRLLDLIGNFSDYDLPQPAPQILNLPFAPQTK